MLSLKAGVKVSGLRPEILLAIEVAYSIFRDNGQADLVITEVTGGKHSSGSLHYVGLAVDIRTNGIGQHAPVLRAKIAEALGADYDVVLEPTHLHVEYQRKE